MNDADGYVRIREAAIALFADRGVDGVSILQIAEAAGVSGGLIRHHFGSKEQLREACDAHVFETAVASKMRNMALLSADPAFVPAYDDRMLRYARYMGRATMDGSAAAARHFRTLVDATAAWLEHESGLAHADPRGMAVVLTAYSIGSLALLDQVARSLGIASGDPAVLDRVATASAAVFATPLFPPELLDRLRLLADSAPQEGS